MRRLVNQLRLNRRQSVGREPAAPTTTAISLCRLSHVLVVLTNVVQLLLMLSFLVLLLMHLNEELDVSWFSIFAPLWVSDAMTLSTGSQEFHRLYRATEGR